MAVRNRVCGPTQCGIIASTTRRTKGGCKPDVGRCMPGANLSRRRPGQAPLGKPALQPYWGKPAVRNDRGDRGNGGIIRSPVRASILPDSHHLKALNEAALDRIESPNEQDGNCR